MAKLNKTLFKGSVILLITFNLYNLFNFVFQFSMARLLTIAEYGILATLYSMIYLLSMFTESIQTVVAKYSANEPSPGKLKNLFNKSLKKAFSISLVFFILYLITAFPLSNLLNITYSLTALNGIMIFTAIFPPISRGIMLGRKRFKQLGFALVIESISKLVIAIFLVLIGLKVYGAIIATFIGVLISFIYSIYGIKNILSSKESKAVTANIYQYSKPVFLLTFIIIAFYSLDVIIAKIVFSAELAGYYALASILGKTIFWGTQPISRAMFPLSAEKKKDNKHNLIINSALLLFLLIAIALLLFYFFPDLILKLFSGKSDISEASKILFYVGIAFSLQAIANLALLYKISLGKIKGYFNFIIFILIEIALMLYFSNSLLEFSIAYILASAIFLWGSIYLLKE